MLWGRWTHTNRNHQRGAVMTAPGLIHVGLVHAAEQDASMRRTPHQQPPPRGGPPRRARGAIAATLARAATRFDAESAKRAIA